MKTLVTGGGGFIGSHVVKQLLERGEKVRVLHLPGENLRNLQGCDVELVEGNVLDISAVKAAIKGCDRVYHLAAVYAFWLRNPQMMFDVNVTGSKNILDACVKHKVERVVYTSSMVRYGGQGPDKKGDENSPFVLGSTGELYSISKFQSHELAERFAEEGLDVRIVCPTLPIGPGDIAPTPTGKYMIGMIKNPVVFYSDSLTNAGDVRDIAGGHLLAMDKGKKGRSYILGGLEDVSMLEFVKLCQEISGQKKPVIRISEKAFEVMGYALEMYAEFISGESPLITSQAARASALGLKADCSRAQTELGYSCRPLKDSIRDAVMWFRENRYC
jgi:dihydroflavonol-4-reductase